MVNRDEHVRLLRAELAHLLADYAPDEGDVSLGHGVTVYRRNNPTALHHGESVVSFCMVAQGSKHVEVGDREYIFTPEDIFIITARLPTVSHVVSASPEEPYLGLAIELNPNEVKSVYLSTTPEALGMYDDPTAEGMCPIHVNMLDATVRLMRTLDKPQEAEFLAPKIKDEIIFRLLSTDREGKIRQIAGMSIISNQIKASLDKMRLEYDQPLRVSEVASSAGMSVSSFHEHFKKFTGLTPLQYQKQLRLREARHRMRTQDIDVAEAGYAVGYSDASHFNRDYKRLFGITPLRDTEAMREVEELAPTGS